MIEGRDIGKEEILLLGGSCIVTVIASGAGFSGSLVLHAFQHVFVIKVPGDTTHEGREGERHGTIVALEHQVFFAA
jgi:hypothetical protein